MKTITLPLEEYNELIDKKNILKNKIERLEKSKLLSVNVNLNKMISYPFEYYFPNYNILKPIGVDVDEDLIEVVESILLSNSQYIKGMINDKIGLRNKETELSNVKSKWWYKLFSFLRL